MVLPQTNLRRHSRNSPREVCSGHAALARGLGQRCAGFRLDLVAYCQRPEFAGVLPLDLSTEPPAYKHLLVGACPCGDTHGSGPRQRREIPVQQARPSLTIELRHEIYPKLSGG